MNAIRNRVQLIGRLGQEPEIFSFEDGNKLAKPNKDAPSIEPPAANIRTYIYSQYIKMK